jgi:hypothetical protein
MSTTTTSSDQSSSCESLMEAYIKCCEKMQKEKQGMSPQLGECLPEKKAYRDCVRHPQK